MTDMDEDERDDATGDDLLEDQEEKGFGDDEWEGEEALEEEE
jgi:hypothetical protein